MSATTINDIYIALYQIAGAMAMRSGTFASIKNGSGNCHCSVLLVCDKNNPQYNHCYREQFIIS